MNPHEQYVCTVCGYNMAGYLPDNCPFCGATRDKFITSQECSARYRVVEIPIGKIFPRKSGYTMQTQGSGCAGVSHLIKPSGKTLKNPG